MNIFKTMAVKDLEEATRAIPVVDFGPAFRGDPGGLEAVAAQVRRASEQVGFFYLAGRHKRRISRSRRCFSFPIILFRTIIGQADGL